MGIFHIKQLGLGIVDGYRHTELCALGSIVRLISIIFRQCSNRETHPAPFRQRFSLVIQALPIKDRGIFRIAPAAIFRIVISAHIIFFLILIINLSRLIIDNAGLNQRRIANQRIYHTLNPVPRIRGKSIALRQIFLIAPFQVHVGTIAEIAIILRRIIIKVIGMPYAGVCHGFLLPAIGEFQIIKRLEHRRFRPVPIKSQHRNRQIHCSPQIDKTVNIHAMLKIAVEILFVLRRQFHLHRNDSLILDLQSLFLEIYRRSFQFFEESVHVRRINHAILLKIKSLLVAFHPFQMNRLIDMTQQFSGILAVHSAIAVQIIP